MLSLSQELEAISAENIGAKAQLEALQQEKLAFLKDKDTMEAALAFAEKERITFKEKNDEAQEELKALDDELERQRQENEEAVSALGLAKSADAQAAVVIKELQMMLSEREEKQQFFEHQITNFKIQAAAANADLESRTCELQVIQKKLDLASSECSSSRAQIAEMDTLLSQKNATLEVLTGDMLNLERQFAATKQELAVRVHELEESVSKISEEKLVLLNKQELQQSTLREVEGERDELISSSEVLQQDINVLTEKMENQESQQTDMISKLENENLKFEALKFEFERQQLELHELESKLTHANSEIDDREEQLRGVHSILLENSKERKLLEEKLAKLEVEKVGGSGMILLV
jgi:chromosome segregation ATPase